MGSMMLQSYDYENIADTVRENLANGEARSVILANLRHYLDFAKIKSIENPTRARQVQDQLLRTHGLSVPLDFSATVEQITALIDEVIAHRRIIQITASGPGYIYALCDDGSVWEYGDRWCFLPAIPQIKIADLK